MIFEHEDIKKICEAILKAEAEQEQNERNDLTFNPLIVAYFRDLAPIIRNSFGKDGKINPELLKDGLKKFWFSLAKGEPKNADAHFFQLLFLLKFPETEKYLRKIVLLAAKAAAKIH